MFTVRATMSSYFMAVWGRYSKGYTTIVHADVVMTILQATRLLYHDHPEEGGGSSETANGGSHRSANIIQE